MNATLLNQIANDLNIVKFKNESMECYTSRILYSSFSLWLKTICLDGITKSTQNNHSISKHHHHKRGESILNSLLEFFPYGKKWFYIDDEEHPVNFMRSRLIYSFDILTLDSTSRLYLHKSECNAINSEYSRILGMPNNNFDFCSGISLVKVNSNPSYQVSYENIESLYNALILNVNFTKDEWDVPKEYFNPFTKTDTLYKCWEEFPPNTDVYISRLTNKFQQNIYFVEKNINNTTYSCQINSFFIESGLLSKILFYIRHKYNNAISVKIEKDDDCFRLKRSVKSFSGEEERFIQSFAWPEKSLHDNLNWCFPICFYDDVIQILNNLFLNIREVNYE